MSTYSFDPAKWGGRAWKPTPRKSLPVIVFNTLDKRVDAGEILEQYNIAAPIEVYTIAKDSDVWYLQHGETRTNIPVDCVRDVALLLKAELENKEAEYIPLPGNKVYRPVLCLLGDLLDEYLSIFREGRTGKMHILTDAEGPVLPEGKTISLRQFYKNVETGGYGPYHDKVEFYSDCIAIEGCETEYTPELGLAVAACLSTGNCTLMSRTV